MFKKLMITTCMSLVFLGFVLFHCNLPPPPAGPEEAKVSLLFKTSDGKIDHTGAIIDSVGKEVQIGMVLYLTQYIDSAVVCVFLDSITKRTFSWAFKKNTVDTVFFPITFTNTGTHKVEVTGYIEDQPNAVAEGKIIIYGPPQVNKSPELKVPGAKTVIVGQAVLFSVSASDPDSGQIITIRASQKTESATFTADSFKWTPATADTGTFKVIFVATDNGVPAISDTDSVTIDVRTTPVDRVPQWIAKNVQRTTKPGALFSYDLRSNCSVPDSDSLTFSLISAPPAKDTIIGTTYSFTPTASDTGKHIIHILAKDSSGFTDTLTFELTISITGVPDSIPPVIKFQSPSNDTVISADSFEVKVTCSDDSGCSVKGFRDTTAFTLKRSASVKNLWTGVAKGIAAGGYSTIKIVATDSSKAKNRDSATVRIKYDNDKSGPVITLVNPVKDSVTINTSSYMVILKVTDLSGVLSVNGASGETAYTGVRDTGSQWKINISTLENNKVTAIVLIATDSSLKANKTSDTVYIRSEIVNGFKVKFDKNDSAATGTMAEQTINSGDSAKLSINTFVKAGSIFAGWMTSPTGTTIAYVDGAIYKMGTVNETLYAKWTKKTTFALTITAANGTVTKFPDAAVYDSGTVVALTPVPSNNYHFSGWSGALAGTVNPATITMNGDKSVTAGFEVNPPNTFTLTVAASNGAVKKTPDLPQYDSGSTVGLKATPNTGYRFVDWSGDATGTTDSTTVVMSKGKSVTANFALIPYQLTVNAVNGTITLPATATVTVNHGVLTPVKAVASTGYSFSGWTVPTGAATITSASVESTTVSLTSGDATVRANFAPIPCTVTFRSQGTTYSTATVNYNALATEPTAPQAGACNTFGGWYISETYATKWNFLTDKITVATTLYAKWTPLTYTVTYDANSASTGTAPAQQTKTCGVALALAAGSLARNGYAFSGWNTASDGTGTDYAQGANYTGNAALALFAKWTPVYTVTYNGNGNDGGNVPVDANKYTNSQTVTVLDNSGSLAKSGSTFYGWNTSSSGTGTPRSPGSTFSIGSANVVLYAVWAPIYTVIFDGQGATVGPNPTTRTVTAPTTTVGTLPTSPTKKSYTFSGWWTGTHGTGTEFTASTTVNSNLTVYANWLIKDIDGNIYTEVTIGSQTWMVENLKTTKYNDGTAIPLVADSASWVSTASEAYCWFNNDMNTYKNFGAIYKWFTVNTGKLAPAGWHVPTDMEWDNLQNYMINNGFNWDGTRQGNKIAKSLAAKSTWATDPTAGAPGNGLYTNNSSGFSALGTGYRDIEGYFGSKDTNACWWSSTMNNAENAGSRWLHCGYEALGNDGGSDVNTGNSIRLIKD
jgi:uncharacterized protein (TIGR02145 family)/uncharacterized repeat protein (TIGR02543 family)